MAIAQIQKNEREIKYGYDDLIVRGLYEQIGRGNLDGQNLISGKQGYLTRKRNKLNQRESIVVYATS